MKNRVGRAVRIVRKARGLTIGDVADRAKLSRAMVTRAELGSSKMSLKSLTRVADALEVPVDVFLSLGWKTLKTTSTRAKVIVEYILHIMEIEDKFRIHLDGISVLKKYENTSKRD